MSESTRAYIYRVALAILALAVAYGVLGPEQVETWTQVLVAALGIGTTGLAVKNTSR